MMTISDIVQIILFCALIFLSAGVSGAPFATPYQ